MTAFRLRELGIVVALQRRSSSLPSGATNFLTVEQLAGHRARTWRSSSSSPSAQTMVVLTRNIDLSVGSIVGLTAYRRADTLRAPQRPPMSSWRWSRSASASAAGSSTVCSSPLARCRRSSPRSRTLAIYRGLVVRDHRRRAGLRVPAAGARSGPRRSRSRSASRRSRGSRSCVALVGAAVLRWTPWGRDFYAIGSNPEAARLRRYPRRAARDHWRSRSAARSPGSAASCAPSRFANVDAVAGRRLRARRDHRGRDRRRQRLRRLGTVLGVVLGALLVGDDPGRLHAPPDLRVLEDLLQRASRSSLRSRSTRSSPGVSRRRCAGVAGAKLVRATQAEATA